MSRIDLVFVPSPAGEEYDGHWRVRDTARNNVEVAHCQDLNWARYIMFALNEAIEAGRMAPGK